MAASYKEEEEEEEEEDRRLLTWRDLARLNERHNAHVAYEGKVYDVSGFLPRHPGGPDQLMYGAGKDVTQLFESYHASGTRQLIARRCKCVGRLVDSEVPTFPRVEEDAFLRAVRKRVAEYFASRKIDPKVNYLAFFRYILFCVLALSFWAFSLLSASACGRSLSLSAGVLLAGLSGFFTAMVAMTIGHDGNHFAITHSPLVWKTVTSLVECIHGLSSVSWVYQHTLGHHVYTNMDEWDPDVVTVKGDEEPDFWRIKPFQQWFPVYRWQHIYMPALYTLLSIKMKLQDFHTFLIMRKASIRMNSPSRTQIASFLAAKAVHFSIKFPIPLYFLPVSLPTLLCLNLASEVVMGGWLAIITQLNHVNVSVQWPVDSSDDTLDREGSSLVGANGHSKPRNPNPSQPPKPSNGHIKLPSPSDRYSKPQNSASKSIKPDNGEGKPLNHLAGSSWSAVQVATTQDYATDSWFWTTFSGALNHQVAHHLFPSVLQCYYPQITPIVARSCLEFGLRYKYVPTAWGAICSHLSHLKRMGACH